MQAGTPIGGTNTIRKELRHEEFTDITNVNRESRSHLLVTTLVTVLALSALVISPGVFFFYDVTPKVVVLLLGCTAVIWMAPQWMTNLRLLGAHRGGRVLLAALALQGASAVLATVASTDRSLSFIGSSWRRLGLLEELALLVFVMAVAAFTVASQQRVTVLLRTICLVGAVGALYGIAQYFGLDPLIPAESYRVGEGEWMIVRTPGTLGHAGYFAIFLMHGFFSSAALARLEQSALWRGIAMAAAALTAATVFLSGTRSAILGLAGGLGFLLIWFRPRLGRRSVAAVLLLIAVSWGFYASPLGQQLRARTRWYVEDPAGGGRLLLWRDSFQMGAERWITGWGLETFSSAFLPYHSVELSQAFPERYYESAHNVVLDAWASQGLLGVAALGALLLAGAVSLRSAVSSSALLAAFVAAGLFGAAVAGQFLAFTAVTKLYFYVQAALLVAAAAPETARRGTSSLHWPAYVLCFGVACLPTYFAVSLARADWRLERVRHELEAGDPLAAMNEYREFAAARPNGYYMDLWFSRQMVAAAAKANDNSRPQLWLAAKEAAQRAAVASETPQNALYNLAFVASQEGDLEAVERSLRAAIAAAPNWYQPYWMLAQVLSASGRLSEAMPLADQAAELSGGNNADVNAVRQSLQEATRTER